MALTILRLATLYGEGDPGNIKRLIRTIDQGRFIWIGAEIVDILAEALGCPSSTGKSACFRGIGFEQGCFKLAHWEAEGCPCDGGKSGWPKMSMIPADLKKPERF